jgi:site-specific DNA-methyltransferase (adenine-specific)
MTIKAVLSGESNFHIECGNSINVLPEIPDNTFHGVVTDPPAGISFMGKSWDKAKDRTEFCALLTPILKEALRVTKPGGRLLCWSIPRTMHWTGCAIEDAGWIIENTLADVYAEELDGVPEEVMAWLQSNSRLPFVSHIFGSGFPKAQSQIKPAREDWWMARKAGPVLPLNIDACRIATTENVDCELLSGDEQDAEQDAALVGKASSGRWPANLLLTHHPNCVEAGTKKVRSGWARPHLNEGKPIYGGFGAVHGGGYAQGQETIPNWVCVEGCPVCLIDTQSGNPHGDSGGASRFFQTFTPDPFIYIAKASRSDRGEDNTHPTVKATNLMRYLVRLVKPQKIGRPLILDCFSGSGSTGKAAVLEGCSFVGIELDPQHVEVSRKRIQEVSETSILDLFNA